MRRFWPLGSPTSSSSAAGRPTRMCLRLERLVAESARARDQRVVVTDASGRVVADSAGTARLGELYATSGRPEFRDALFQGRIDTRTRYSDTLGEDLLLVTVPVVDRGRVVGAVRLSAGTEAVETAVRASWLRLALLGGVVIVAGVARRLAPRAPARPPDSPAGRCVDPAGAGGSRRARSRGGARGAPRARTLLQPDGGRAREQHRGAARVRRQRLPSAANAAHRPTPSTRGDRRARVARPESRP